MTFGIGQSAPPTTSSTTLRKFARATIELAQEIKHIPAPNRTQAGIAADAVIQLANMLRRVAQPE